MNGCEDKPFFECITSKLLRFALVGIFLGGFVGCKDENIAATTEQDIQQIAAVGSQTKKAGVYDVGVVNKDLVFDCVVGGSEKKIIDHVTKSCGCATVGLEKGDLLDFDKPFKVSVSMQGKPAGKGSQDVAIGFKDGTVFLAKIKYTYRPLPSITPEYLVFKTSDEKKIVAFEFPGESNVSIIKPDLPAGVTSLLVTHPDDKKSNVVLELQVNRSLLNGVTDGVIDITTSSDRQAKFRIPYLILEN